MYLGGLSMGAIAKQLQLSSQTIYADICLAREQWRTRMADAIDKQKQQELAKVDHIESEAWKAWERSIGNAKTTTKHVETGPVAGGKKYVTEKTEKLNGDPRYLAIIADCVKKRCEILGLDSPKKLTGAEDGPILLKVIYENQK
jgi:hypothetical protein